MKKTRKIIFSILTLLFIVLSLVFKTTNYIEIKPIIIMLALIFVTNIFILLLTNKKSVKNDILDILSFFTNAVVIALIISNFVLFTSLVDGHSMEPTIHDGQRLYINKYLINVKNDDIVIYKNNEEYIVKRVAAIKDDVLTIIEENSFYYLAVNGVKYQNKQNESYELSETDLLYIQIGVGYTLKENELILLGDNAKNSNDSRQNGVFNMKYVIGKRIGSKK